MAVKGHTRIELYNPNTKIKNVTESDNVFQGQVLAEYMRACGEINRNPYDVQSWRNRKPWANLVGGLLLFKNRITVPSGGIVRYMPAGNEMIANASYGVTNSGDPTEMGSYNETESSASASSITQVYDFGTSQGNGSISCACLTSRVGGYIGYGNASGTKHPTSMYLDQDQYATSDTYRIGSGKAKYKFELTETKLTVTKRKAAILQGSVFDTFETTKEFPVSHSFGSNDVAFYVGNGKFIIPEQLSGNSDYEVGDQIWYIEFDENTQTIEEKYWTNTCTKSINNNNQARGSYYTEDKIFARSGDRTSIEVFDYNSVHYASIPISDYYYNQFRGGKIAPGLFWTQDANRIECIYDEVNDTMRPVNSDSSLSGYNIDDVQLIQLSSTRIVNPLYLATINNLSSAVNKSASQTMKVTYTLTDIS